MATSTNAPGVPAPVPRPKATGSAPIVPDIGATVAMTKKITPMSPTDPARSA